jgi:hypothetical protein
VENQAQPWRWALSPRQDQDSLLRAGAKVRVCLAKTFCEQGNRRGNVRRPFLDEAEDVGSLWATHDAATAPRPRQSSTTAAVRVVRSAAPRASRESPADGHGRSTA